MTLAKPVALAVTASATSRCIGGKVVLTVTAQNNATVPVDVTVATSYGSKRFTAVAPGKNASAAFSTRAPSIPAGEITVTATGAVDGTSVKSVIPAPYAARSCT